MLEQSRFELKSRYSITDEEAITKKNACEEKQIMFSEAMRFRASFWVEVYAKRLSGLSKHDKAMII